MIAAKPQRSANIGGQPPGPLFAFEVIVFASPMRRVLAFAAMVLGSASAAPAVAPLYEPVALNIGLACQWQQACINKQNKAMKRALKYVRKEEPPTWRIHLCNRNASRKGQRVDWIGFDHCIRNTELQPPPATPPAKKRTRRAG